MQPIEHFITMLPTGIMLARLTPPGLEGTMTSFSFSIIILNQFMLRLLVGAVINGNFVHPPVEAKNIKDFPKLMIIQFFGTLIPMTYIYCMVPLNKKVLEI